MYKHEKHDRFDTDGQRGERRDGLPDGDVWRDVLDAALAYVLKCGWTLLPVGAGATSTPLVPWAPGQEAPPERAVVESWFRRWPNANIGVVTGAASGIIVLEVAGHEGVESLRRRYLPATPTARTPRGIQLYLAYPGCPVRNSVGLLPRVRVHGDGHCVIAPPSPGYRWVEGLSPWDVPLAICPGWLLPPVVADARPTRQLSRRALSLLP